MPDRSLRLMLRAGATLPCNLSWKIEDGYVRMTSWGEDADPITLGIWGPGDLVIPALIGIEPVELLSMSNVEVEEATPNKDEERRFVEDQLRQTTNLLLLNRIRPADRRLFRLLTWLGKRFGRVNSQGVSLSFEDMNLTHRQLADVSGITRVTVTKVLTRFRQDGRLIKNGSDETLTHIRREEITQTESIDYSVLSERSGSLQAGSPHLPELRI